MLNRRKHLFVSQLGIEMKRFLGNEFCEFMIDNEDVAPCSGRFGPFWDAVSSRAVLVLLAAAALVTFVLMFLCMPQAAQAATLLAPDGKMGFVSNDDCGAVVQAGVAEGYVAPTTARAGQHKDYKKFTLAELGKVNGLCVTGDTKYKVGTVVYLPSTFVVAVKAGNPVANWEKDMHMWKCMNKIQKIWTIDPKPVASPTVPTRPADSPAPSKPAVLPTPGPTALASTCELDQRSDVYLCEGPKPDHCGCYILANSVMKKNGTKVPQNDLWFPKAHNDSECARQQQALWTSRGGGKFKTVQVGS